MRLRLSRLLLLSVLFVSVAYPWGSTGHRIINAKAIYNLPPGMSLQIADSTFISGHASDADYRKVSGDTSFWNEGQRHFIDIDWYPNFHSLPHSLDSVIALYGRNRVRDEGTNPWATMIFLDSLTEQLRRGDNASVEQTMADLGHYVGDAHQPLHCTQNYDGAMTGNSGIHSRYESTMINNNQSAIIVHPDSIHYISRPLDFAFDYIYHSNSLVDSIMAADTYAKAVSGWSGSGTPPSSYYTALWQKCSGFTIDQFQRATVDLASLWYTAWMNAVGTPISYDTILAHITGSGTIVPSGTVIVESGSDRSFTIQPSTGFHVDSIYVDGAKVDSLAGYTFTQVNALHTIEAYVSINQYTLASSAGPNGTIQPDGLVTVNYGDSQGYTMTPATGHHIDSLIVDGTAQPASPTFNFPSVSANHSIRAVFAIDRFVLNASAGLHGSIVPSGAINVVYSDSQIFVIRPDSGYFIDSVLIDGAFAGTDSTYIFRNISQAHSISAKFSNGTVTWVATLTNNWNLLSVPVVPTDFQRTALYPAALTEAFAYEGTYQPKDTLRNGTGYWMKFSGSPEISITGYPLAADTIAVVEGWNLIGTIGVPIVTSQIQSSPGGLVTSSFFGYAQNYRPTDTLRPGYGYWVKVSQAGDLILSANSSSGATNRIQIVATGEQPPAAPGGISSERSVPAAYALGAFPNPFNPTATIHFELPAASHVVLKVYTMLGQEVQTLVEGDRQAGRYDVVLDGSNMSSGVYFYRLTTKSYSEAKKIILAK